MNDILSRQGTFANVSLDEAKDLLKNLSALAGAQTEVLQKRIEDLEAAAERAKEVADQMADEAASIEDQIDELNGDDTAIEDRRHLKALQDIKDEATKNNTLNTAAYNNLVKLGDQLHALKLKHIKEQQQAQNPDDVSSTNGSGSANSKGAAAARPSGGAIPPGAVSRARRICTWRTQPSSDRSSTTRRTVGETAAQATADHPEELARQHHNKAA